MSFATSAEVPGCPESAAAAPAPMGPIATSSLTALQADERTWLT
jgi:hypothetical protein